jgi:hypothetical protein
VSLSVAEGRRLISLSLRTCRRLTDHFLGKQHIGFQFMRDSLEAIRARREERRFAILDVMVVENHD